MRFCGCEGRKRAEVPQDSQTIDSPLQMQLVKMLGLKNYLLDKFVFRRKPSTYQIRSNEDKKVLFLDKEKYCPPSGYTADIRIIETDKHSVPIVKLTPKNLASQQTLPCIIYAHGNSSDMGDSLFFVTRMAPKFGAEYIVFDYTGYGQSKKKEVGEEIICKDLQIVLAWANQPLQNILLWGFSLGTFPVVSVAAKFNIAACILQCPIGSISCMFYDEYAVNTKFKEDHFANIDNISQIKSQILMMHSTEDEIIPIEQARLLYNKYIHKRGQHNIEFIEVQKIKHNSFHRYISSKSSNDLQNQVLNFLYRVTTKLTVKVAPNELQTTLDSNLPEDLVKLQERLTTAKIEQHCFDEEDYQLLELNELPQKKSTRKGLWSTFCSAK